MHNAWEMTRTLGLNASVLAVTWWDKVESVLSVTLLLLSIWWTVMKLIDVYRDWHGKR